MTCTFLSPRLGKGSLFLDLIFAYMSWLNLVVIFAKRKHLLKKKKKGASNEELNKVLTFLLFCLNSAQDISRRLQAKAVQSQSARIDQIVEIVN